MLVAASSPLTKIIPGLMIWTIIFFLIVFFVLRKYAFGAIQRLIDERREQIRRSIEEADNARDEARKLLEEHRQLIGQARSQAEEILSEARKTRESMEQRMREETETERQRRLEETRKEIDAAVVQGLERIRTEVAELALEATSRIVGERIDSDRDRELIASAIGALDFTRLEDLA